MTISTEQVYPTKSMDHATKRVLLFLIVGFVLIGFLAPWVQA
jgi:hypothetical protein